MEMKITIETWNDVWRFEIEDKEFGERVKWGESDSFTGCAAVCLEFVAENKNAAEQSGGSSNDKLDGVTNEGGVKKSDHLLIPCV